MSDWSDILDAVGVALRGEPDGGARLTTCWAGTADGDHAQRCVIAHYLADREDRLEDEVAWDELALAEFRHCGDGDLAPIGMPTTAALAPSLHLNLGDGYLRQGRAADAREQLAAGLAAVDALSDDGYGRLVRGGLDRLRERLDDQGA